MATDPLTAVFGVSYSLHSPLKGHKHNFSHNPRSQNTDSNGLERIHSSLIPPMDSGYLTLPESEDIHLSLAGDSNTFRAIRRWCFFHFHITGVGVGPFIGFRSILFLCFTYLLFAHKEDSVASVMLWLCLLVQQMPQITLTQHPYWIYRHAHTRTQTHTQMCVGGAALQLPLTQINR